MVEREYTDDFFPWRKVIWRPSRYLRERPCEEFSSLESLDRGIRLPCDATGEGVPAL